MHLLYTGVVRESTRMLEKVVKSDRQGILDVMLLMEESILNNNLTDFINLVNQGWDTKKKSLPQILEGDHLKSIDDRLTQDSRVLAHRLCGAGNGGYFLILCDKGYTPDGVISIDIDKEGVQAYEI